MEKNGYWYAYVHNDPVNCVDLWGLTASDSSYYDPKNPNNGKTRLDMASSGNRNPYEAFVPYVSDDLLNYVFSTEMRELVGTPYVLGGNSSDGTDCSGSIILALENVAKRAGKDISLPDYTAKEMSEGKAPYITPLTTTDPSAQGSDGMINFYTWDEDEGVEHVNTGVGQRGGETTNQVVDATEGDWMSGRNGNSNQAIPAQAGTINQTYTPYTTNYEPSSQAVVNWDYMRELLW